MAEVKKKRLSKVFSQNQYQVKGSTKDNLPKYGSKKSKNSENDENGNKNKPAGQYSNGLLRLMLRICGFFVQKISKAFVVSRFLRFRNLIKNSIISICHLL